MENASKALLMAGGVLLTMLVVMLLIFASGRFKDFYNRKDELASIEKISEFNSQFTAFDERTDIGGYELISLANKIADYNMRYSNVEEAQNDERYTPITMIITFSNNYKELWYETDKGYLFTGRTITQSNVKNEIQQIIKNEEDTVKIHGGLEATDKLVKNISTLLVNDDKIEELFNQYKRNYNGVFDESNESEKTRLKSIAKKELESQALKTYNQITRKSINSYSELKNLLFMNNVGDLKKYYEYYQFKKGIFKCEKIDQNKDYDSVSGRIKEIRFNFTGINK